MQRRWGNSQEQIKVLQQELWSARYAIIGMAPPKYDELLRGFYRCDDRSESYRWLDSIAEQIVEIVEPLPDGRGSNFGPRANCPLCGDESSSPYQRGFALPEGLRRHLTGWGRSRKCVVTEAAHQLALDHFHDRFSAVEEAKHLKQQKIKTKRKRSEVLLRIGPGIEPALMDDVGDLDEPRNKAEWAKAESRLHELNFEKTEKDRVRQYVRETEKYEVFADPRNNKEINFRVCRKPFPKRIQRDRLGLSRHFVIKDAWKHNILDKFDVRLEKALTEP